VGVAVGLEQRLLWLIHPRAEAPRWTERGEVFGPSPRCPVEVADLVHPLLPSPRPPAEPVESVRWAVPGVWGDEPTPESIPEPSSEPVVERLVPSIGELVAQAQELLEQLARVDPSVLPPGQALGEAAALAGLMHRLRHLQLARTADVSARGLHELLGYRSVSAWQQHTAPDSPASDRTLARRLAGSPHLAQALANRRVSFTAASRSVALLRQVRGQLDRPDGLIDGQPGEPVITAVVEHTVQTICQERCGLEHDPQVDAVQAAFLTQLETHAQQILTDSTSQRERLERAVLLLATHLPPKALIAALEQLRYQLLPSVLEEREQAARDKRALALSPHSDGT
jgi:hypothetical protein